MPFPRDRDLAGSHTGSQDQIPQVCRQVKSRPLEIVNTNPPTPPPPHLPLQTFRRIKASLSNSRKRTTNHLFSISGCTESCGLLNFGKNQLQYRLWLRTHARQLCANTCHRSLVRGQNSLLTPCTSLTPSFFKPFNPPLAQLLLLQMTGQPPHLPLCTLLLLLLRIRQLLGLLQGQTVFGLAHNVVSAQPVALRGAAHVLTH